jgi:glucosylceramidase
MTFPPVPGGAGSTFLHAKKNLSDIADAGTALANLVDGPVISAAQYRTTSDGANTVTYAGLQAFAQIPQPPVANLQTITVRPDVSYQQILGVGAALTDAACYALLTYLTSAQLTALLTELFGSAAGFSTVRISLGWQNFTSVVTPFSYDDVTGTARTLGCTNGSNVVTDGSAATGDAGKAINLITNTGTTGFAGNSFIGTVTAGTGYTVVTAPGGSTASNFLATTGSYAATLYPLDLTLANFTLGADLTNVVPVLQQIMAINPRVKVFASLWSPPNWMRVTGTLTGTPDRSSSAQAANSDVQTYLLPQLGLYITQAIEAYQALGIPVYAVCPQNEPFDATGSLCYYTDADYATLITDTGAAIDTAGLQTRVYAHDHHWSFIGRITPDDGSSIDATAFLTQAAARYVTDIGYHAYSEENDNYGVTWRPVGNYGTSLGQQMVRRYKNTVANHVTEIRAMLTQTWPSAISLIAAACVAGNFQRYGASLTMWNLALDQAGAPNQGVSPARRGVITINNSTGVITRNPEYWILRSIGAFVRPGAVRVGCTTPIVGGDGQDLQAVAFANPDGTTVCFAVNNSPYARAAQITDARTGDGFTVTLQPYEFDTFTWTGSTASGTPAYTPAVPASIILDTATAGGSAQANSVANAGSLTWPHTVGDGNHPVLVVGIPCVPENSTTPNVTAVTFGGTALTKLGAAFYAGSPSREADIWYLIAPPAGPGTVLVTLAAAGAGPLIGFSSSWFNVSQSGPFRTAILANSAGSTTGLSVATTGGAATDVVLGCYSVRQNSNNTVNGFQVGQIRLGQVTQAGTLNLFGCMTQQAGGTGTITTTFVNSDGASDTQAAIVAALVNG